MAAGTSCPKGTGFKPTAVVNSDSPILGYIGWVFLALGFVTQFFSIEKPMLSGEDLRILRKARKIIESTQY
ncbi:MAG: hypothetical protein ACLPTQ_08905 [Terriglobales bacterium]